MFATFARTRAEFPRQFWILIGGTFINSFGAGMLFPFLTLYLFQSLGVSMTLVGVLLSLWSVSGLIGQLAGGSLADRIGRKPMMAFSLGASALFVILFGIVSALPLVALAIFLLGITGNAFQPARDAMIADLIPEAKRAQAFALTRIAHNIGIGVGPALGGFLAAYSYVWLFAGNALFTFLFFGLTLIWIQETKPTRAASSANSRVSASFADVFRDARLIIFCVGAVSVVVAASQMFTVLPVFMKNTNGLGENYFGWIMTTNAAMVVTLQYAITRAGARFPRLPYAAVGALFYGVGAASIAVATTFPHFILAMGIVTIGEMIFAPTATAIIADLAPVELRGRYMAMLGLTWTVGFGIGPILGGLISDTIAPRAAWLPAGLAAIVGAGIFLFLARIINAPKKVYGRG
ncbi:MAG: MFS transporter [Chloroflexi bacterium]|nr:MFS transporter [Chloroflexota bacterium]